MRQELQRYGFVVSVVITAGKTVILTYTGGMRAGKTVILKYTGGMRAGKTVILTYTGGNDGW